MGVCWSVHVVMHLLSVCPSLSLSLHLPLGVCQAVGSDGVRAMMESALTARDRVGVQDFVLLENHTSEVAFIDNLRKRFKENLIYVRISSLLFLINVKVLGAFILQRSNILFPLLNRRTLAQFWCR